MIFVLLDDSVQLVYQVLVVRLAVRQLGMVAVAHDLVERLDVPDEHISFPSFGVIRGEIILVEQERHLQPRGVDQAGGTCVLLGRLALQPSENGELHHRHANLVEAHSLGGVWRGNALGCVLDVGQEQALEV